MTTTLPASAMLPPRRRQGLPQVRPVPGEPVGVTRRGLGRLGLEPPDRARPGVGELMDATDPGPAHVSRTQTALLAIEHRINVTLEDQIRLLERVVVRPRHALRLVLNHEHRGQ